VNSADQLRGENLNAPLNGIRPNPDFANIIQTVSDGQTHSDQLSTTLNVNLAGGVRNTAAALWNLRRTTFRVTYWIARANNDFDGPFVVPPSGSLAAEWAAAPGDRRHRYQVSLNSQALKNLNASFSLGGNTGTPYNITTGFDNNDDSIFNDRPGRSPQQRTHVGAGDRHSQPDVSIALGAASGQPRAQDRPGGGERGDRASQAGGAAIVRSHAGGQQSDQSPELLRLQRNPDLAVFLTPTSVVNPEDRLRHRSPILNPPRPGCHRPFICGGAPWDRKPHDGSARSQLMRQMLFILSVAAISLQSSGSYQIIRTHPVGGTAAGTTSFRILPTIDCSSADRIA
jgi:hypothetical protein